MNPTKTFRRALAGGALALVALATACSPEQIAQYQASQEIVKAQLASSRSQSSLSDAQLARLAKCESGGNPKARSRTGRYMGLYQFNQQAWNGIAKSVLPSYVGVRPSDAPAWVQDGMARGLYAQLGARPWPVCGRRI